MEEVKGSNIIYITDIFSGSQEYKDLMENTELVYEKKVEDKKKLPKIEGTDYVWCLGSYDKIKKYKLSELFDISGSRFSNGWGGSWYYVDEDKTWSKNPAVLYEKLYDKKREAANKYNMVESIANAEIPQLQKDLAIKALLYGFVGTMYGEKYKPSSDLVELNINRVDLAFEKDIPMGFIYVWGWPGPDYNLYKFEDFGKTWAFNKEDFLV